MAVLSLPQDYGYVISAGIGAIFMVIWKGVRVGMVEILEGREPVITAHILLGSEEARG